MTLWQDVRFGVRTLAKRPGFALVAVLTLALGIGANTAFFPVVGVEPARGRAFLPEDDAEGGGRVAVLAHELWQRRFGGDAEIVGRSLVFNGEPYTVVGVLPEGFRFPTI